MTGSVSQPHTTKPGDGTSKIRLVNSRSGAAFKVQWRQKKGAGEWSEFFGQNHVESGLLGGDYTVNFKMASSPSPHVAPIDEQISLGANADERLKVVWA